MTAVSQYPWARHGQSGEGEGPARGWQDTRRSAASPAGWQDSRSGQPRSAAPSQTWGGHQAPQHSSFGQGFAPQPSAWAPPAPAPRQPAYQQPPYQPQRPAPQQWPPRPYPGAPYPPGGYPQAAWPTAPGRPVRRRRSSVTVLVWVVVVGLALVGGVGALGALGESGSTGGGTAYKNETYQVPPPDSNPPDIPMPEYQSELTSWTRDNKVYQVSVARPVRCELPDLDYGASSDAQVEKHLNELTACLMRVWGPALEQAGYTAVRPTVTVYTGHPSTACGKAPSENAFYCAGDQQIYFSHDLPDAVPADLRGKRLVVEAIMAHEFGHAIQARTGILAANSIAKQQFHKAGKDAEELVAGRRSETQADCLSGQFTNAVGQSLKVSSSDQANLRSLFRSFGDDVGSGGKIDPGEGNHGSGESRQSWYSKGLASVAISTCNTFSAPDSQVR